MFILGQRWVGLGEAAPKQAYATAARDEGRRWRVPAVPLQCCCGNCCVSRGLQGNMFDFLVSRGGRLGEEEAARVVMKPLMGALAFLHSQSFLHRVRQQAGTCYITLSQTVAGRCRPGRT